MWCTGVNTNSPPQIHGKVSDDVKNSKIITSSENSILYA